MAGGLEETIQAWRRRRLGIYVLSLVVDDADGERATIEAARAWRDTHGLRSAYVAADPTSKLAEGRYMTPMLTVVDPRTMRIQWQGHGWSGSHPDALVKLAEKNHR